MKIVGVGFQKTGTTTLNAALTELGYKVHTVKKKLVKPIKAGNLKPVFALADKYDALEDNPWAILYKELDQKYPGSKFILTLRDEEKWLKSLVNYFGTDSTEMREWIYGIGFPKGNEEIYLNRYRQHNQEVQEYFKDRPDDLLVVSWEQGDGWKEICEFLGHEIPSKEFPHANKASYTNINNKDKKSGFLKKLFSK